MNELPRRKLLAVTGTALTGAVAGCSGSDDDPDDSTEADEPDTGDEADSQPSETDSSTSVEGTVLGDVIVDNSGETAHTVDVLVEFDREIEAWSTETLEANEDVTLDRNWPTEPGQFRVVARLDQGEPVEITPARWNDPDCLNLYVRIGREGTLTFLSDTSGGPCGDGDADIDDAES
ncbi:MULTISPECIES: hypothetical protein [Natronorubrum]|uniref:Uncharacterized protein n=2 Tax=Natronorubrum bangense TaxID=61858 RepID=L9WPH5_9EURY|nr:hypothetical protein [Natronorubrum bangense]ELY50248.1 hypothetical protein C494_05553 [Natronorubrum bangense JCM 10635]QCC54305.1 hypothetical protein DV706_07275 [Natronorubrum bangense]